MENDPLENINELAKKTSWSLEDLANCRDSDLEYLTSNAVFPEKEKSYNFSIYSNDLNSILEFIRSYDPRPTQISLSEYSRQIFQLSFTNSLQYKRIVSIAARQNVIVRTANETVEAFLQRARAHYNQSYVESGGVAERLRQSPQEAGNRKSGKKSLLPMPMSQKLIKTLKASEEETKMLEEPTDLEEIPKTSSVEKFMPVLDKSVKMQKIQMLESEVPQEIPMSQSGRRTALDILLGQIERTRKTARYLAGLLKQEGQIEELGKLISLYHKHVDRITGVEEANGCNDYGELDDDLDLAFDVVRKKKVNRRKC